MLALKNLPSDVAEDRRKARIKKDLLI